MPIWAIALIIIAALYLIAFGLTAIIKAGERREEQRETNE